LTWHACTLGQVVKLQRGHDLPERARVVGSVPVVSSAGVTGWHNVAKADPPGVVTGRYGTIGEVFFIDGPYWPLNTALYVVDFKGNKGTQWKKDACKEAFRTFIQAHDQFKDLQSVADGFFTHVRCGILHQAETTGNWTVNRGATLYSMSGSRHRLSAEAFGRGLRSALNTYTDDLTEADWKDPLWRNARKKFRSVCRNCGLPDNAVKKLQ
jgi:hypothetical protein